MGSCFFAQPDIIAEHPPPYAAFSPYSPSRDVALRGSCASACPQLCFSWARMRYWAPTLPSLPLFFLFPLSLLVLMFLQGESCVCICLCSCTKETHCAFRVGFWLNKFKLLLVRQRVRGYISKIWKLILSFCISPCSHEPLDFLQVKWQFVTKMSKFVSEIQRGIDSFFFPPPPFCSHYF